MPNLNIPIENGLLIKINVESAKLGLSQKEWVITKLTEAVGGGISNNSYKVGTGSASGSSLPSEAYFEELPGTGSHDELNLMQLERAVRISARPARKTASRSSGTKT